MPARRGRTAKGDRRIDACIDRFVDMGYSARVVRAVVNDLLKVYGGSSPEAWKVLEDGVYQVVQDRLFEIEEEEKQKQKQDQQLRLEYHQPQDDQQVGDEPPQHQEQVADEEMEEPMFIEPQDIISNSKGPAVELADEEVDPMLFEPPACEAALPLLVTRTDPRRPCFGWLTESEDEEEEQPNPGERVQKMGS